VNQDILLGANPWLADDPQTLMSLSTSGADPQQLVTGAAALAGMDSIDRLANSMGKMSDVGQRAVYGQLTEQQQRALNTMGYNPIPDKGFLDGVPGLEQAFDATAKVASVAFKPVAMAAKPLMPAMDLLMWIGDVPGHLYRAIRQMENWQQWVALGVAAAAVGGAVFTGGASLALLPGTLGTLGMAGAIGLGSAAASTAVTSIVSGTQNPTEWWDIMNPFGATGVGRGEKIFLKSGQEKARTILGQAEHLHAMARDISVNTDIGELAQDFAGVRDSTNQNVLVHSIERVASGLADPGTVEFQRVYAGLAELIEQDEFLEAIDALQTSKISFGRDVANVAQIQQGTTMHKWVSGAADAMWLLTMDPTMALGKAGKLAHLARRGVEMPKGADAIRMLTRMVNEDQAVARVALEVSAAVDAEDIRLMPKMWRQLFDPMVEYKKGIIKAKQMKPGDAFDTEQFLKYIEHGDGLTQILSGKGTVKGIEHIVISAQSRTKGMGKWMEEIKGFEKGITDATFIDDLKRTAEHMGVDNPVAKLLPDLDVQSVDTTFKWVKNTDALAQEMPGYIAGKALGEGLLYVPGGRSFANFVSGITTMIPKGKALAMTGDQAPEDIHRFVESMGRHMNMPSYMRDEWLSNIFRQGTIAQRQEVVVSFMDSLMKAGGLHNSDEMMKLSNKYINKYRQAFAYGGDDVLQTVNGSQRVVGYLPEHHQSVFMVMPDLREMSAVIRQGHALKWATKVVDHDFVEYGMSKFIKPGWLMRIGFIPRAAGEEMLAFMMRMSEGGLLQEFAARGAADWDTYRTAQGKLALMGDINKLAPHEIAALQGPRMHVGFRTLERMGRRMGWVHPQNRYLDNYMDWQNDVRKSGVFGGKGSRFTNNDWLDELPQWQKQLLFGRDQSVRRGLLAGIDPVLQDASEAWVKRHAGAVMEATSAMNMSLMERSLVRPDIETTWMRDPLTGERKEVFIKVNGERSRVGQGSSGGAGTGEIRDERYTQGVYTQVTEALDDPIFGPVQAKHNLKLSPVQEGTYFGRQNYADSMAQMTVIDSHQSKVIVSEFLQPRTDTWRHVGTKLEHPVFREIMSDMVRQGDQTIGGFMIRLEDQIDELKLLHRNEYNDRILNEAKAMYDRMEAVQPIIEGLDALTPAHRSQVTAILTKQMHQPDIEFVEQLQRWADPTWGKAVPKQPANVLHRGVTDDFTHEMLPNGDLVLYPQTQNQWGNTKAVSMSTDPAQSLQYNTRRGASDYNNGPVFDGGTMLEFDRDFMYSQWNRTHEELLANPSTYENTLYTGDGPYAVMKEGQATEIAFATDQPIVVPATKWRAVGGEDYQKLVAKAQETAPAHSPVHRIQTHIYDMPMEDVIPQVDEALDAFVATLSPDEKLWLRDILNEDVAKFTDYANSGGIVSAKDYGNGVIADIIMKDDYAELADPAANDILMKIKDFAKYETGGVSNGDLLMEIVRIREDKIGALDDVFRARLGIRGKGLRGQNNPYAGKAALETQTGDSSLDRWLRDGWDMRGKGGWDTTPEVQQTWSPIYDNYSDMRDGMVDDLAGVLARPENAQYVRQSAHMLEGPNGTPVAQPAESGVTRIYTPVVAQKSHAVEALLNGHWQAVDDAERLALIQVAAKVEGDSTIREVLDASAVYYTDIDNNPVANAIHKSLGEPSTIDNGELISTQLRQDLRDFLATKGPQEEYSVMAQQLLGTEVPHRYSDEFIDAMEYDEKVELLAVALKHMDNSKARYSQPVSQSLDTMATDDPRVAKWLSSMLSDSDQPQRVGMLDVPFMATREGVGGSGLKAVQNLEKRKDGHNWLWELDQRYQGAPTPYDATHFQHVPYSYTAPGGKSYQGFDIVPGESAESAMRGWAETIVDNAMLKQRRGMKESSIFKGETRVGRMVGDQVTPLQKGDVSNQPEDLFRLGEDGMPSNEAVPWGNNAEFDHAADAMSEELMWGIIGPKIRDLYEEPAGLATRVPKSFVEPKRTLGGHYNLGDKPHVDQQVMLSRSRVDDVYMEPEATLPNVAITQNYKLHKEQIWERIVRYGFDNVIGPAIDSLARKPMSFHYFAQAYKQNNRNLAWMLDTELFEGQFKTAFDNVIAALDDQSALSAQAIEDARLLSETGYGITLLKGDEADAQKWLLSLGREPDEFVAELSNVQQSYRAKAAREIAAMPGAPTDPDLMPSWIDQHIDASQHTAITDAAERLKYSANPQAMQVNLPGDVMGKRTSAERLVRAYDATIPDDVWIHGGREGVEEFLKLQAPHLPSNFTDDQWNALTKARTQLHEALRAAEDAAAARAIDNMIPFLDSHEERSMFAEYGRNFLPFWYAEENFIKRWGRTLGNGKLAIPGTTKYMPSFGVDTFRKAQLTYSGMKSGGIVRTDANGEDWVVYPGSTQLTWALDKVLPGDVEPIGVLFQAKTDSLLPGVTPDGHVGPAPMAAVPVHFLTHMFPDARGLKNAVLGEVGATRGVVDQIVPGVLTKAWSLAFNDETSDQRYASAMMTAMAYAEAEDRGLKDNATSKDMDDYLDRMRNHARIIMTAQMLLGYVVPGSPSALATGEISPLASLLPQNIEDPRAILSDKYRTYVDNLGVEAGTAAFLKNHENSDLEDIVNPSVLAAGSGTESVSGAPLPATAQGINWYVDNKDWVDQSPEAGAWLIPQDKAGSGFERDAYNQQLSNGLRKRRTPEEYLRAVKFRQGAIPYFENKDLYDEAVLVVGDDAQRKRDLDDRWKIWSTNFKAANPLFAEQLQDSDSRIRRAKTIEQLRYAVNDPEGPNSPYIEPVKLMSSAYDQYTAKLKLLQGRRDAAAREEKRQLKANFENWAETWTLQYPDLERLWTSVYRPSARID